MPPLVLRYSRSIFLPRTFRPFQSLLPLLPTFSSHTSWHRHTFPPRFAATLIPRRRPDQIWAQTLAEEIVDVMELDFEDLKEYKGHANAVKEMARGESFGAAGARANMVMDQSPSASRV
ncbi:hypothetical protein M427DRAFT_36964 [Gonapodya prolifera JEL478]|uniref:Uncharacterized protein n=1 Tax=Gonapodya prolifera (strain JEL478) TaxID=1344416 RepID=A0A139A215_GONPJ|nr:hypothetical protein M427DRAFT_36964 [Gonapodya prolifera JEL478]|eukprot:KXS10585.1 hypothetical protein M427DRAFT_36964 [Gonapodya prolifera JEL478]